MLRRCIGLRCAASGATATAFDRLRAKTVADLTSNANDRSLAGGVDPQVRALVDRINECPDLFTTSSCGGRVTLFHRVDDAAPPLPLPPTGVDESQPVTPAKAKRGRGLGVLFSSHDPLESVGDTATQLWRRHVEAGEGALAPPTAALGGFIEAKYEPLILHVRCRDLDTGERLLKAATQAGYRRSGLVSLRLPASISAAGGNQAPLVEVKGGFGFNTLVCVGRDVLVSGPNSLAAVFGEANRRFAENERRKARLTVELERHFFQ